MLRVPAGSVLVGATLVESRLGSLLGLHVLGIVRNGHTKLSPDPTEVLHAGDGLLVEGRIERLKELGNWRRLSVYETGRGRSTLEELFAEGNKVAESVVASNSPMVGKSLAESGFRTRFGVSVLAILQDGQLKRTDLRDERSKGGDALLLHGPSERLEQVRKTRRSKTFGFLKKGSCPRPTVWMKPFSTCGYRSNPLSLARHSRKVISEMPLVYEC